MRNLEEYNNVYKDKLCFIIGSGPSLHFQDLGMLDKHLTIAVNSGYLAFPNANFFVSDDWAVADWSYFSKDLVEAECTTVLLYEDNLQHAASMFGDRAVLFRHRRGYHLTEPYKHEEYEYRIFEAQTSVGTAIHIAYNMGCRKIILLGIDDRYHEGKRYFWQFRKDKPFQRGKFIRNYRKIVRLGAEVSEDEYGVVSNLRRATDSNINLPDADLLDVDLLGISKYWKELYKNLQGHCDVFNASHLSRSSLFPKIKLSESMRLSDEKIAR